MSTEHTFETLVVRYPAPHVAHILLNRPGALNAMNAQFFIDLADAVALIDADPSARVAVISGAGRAFSAGLDLKQAAAGAFSPQKSSDGVFAAAPAAAAPAAAAHDCDSDDDSDDGDDVARMGLRLRGKIVRPWQDAFTGLARARVPVIAAVHGPCVGGGVDLISAVDVRLAAADAWFSVLEVKIGIVADLGSLQRLPRIIGSSSLVRELAYTGRRMDADEAKDCGLVSHVYPDSDAVLAAALDMARDIAANSPVVVAGTKDVLNVSEECSVAQGLHYVGAFNALAAQSDDVKLAVLGHMTKSPPLYSNL